MAVRNPEHLGGDLMNFGWSSSRAEAPVHFAHSVAIAGLSGLSGNPSALIMCHRTSMRKPSTPRSNQIASRRALPNDLCIAPVEVGLLLQEGMEKYWRWLRPFPGRAAEVADPMLGGSRSPFGQSPDRARCTSRASGYRAMTYSLKPGCWSLLWLGTKSAALEPRHVLRRATGRVRERPEQRIDVAIIGKVIAESAIGEGRSATARSRRCERDEIASRARCRPNRRRRRRRCPERNADRSGR